MNLYVLFTVVYSMQYGCYFIFVSPIAFWKNVKHHSLC